MDGRTKKTDEVCAAPVWLTGNMAEGLAPGIYPASVYRCADPDDAEARLAGTSDAYVYQRDRHPNADLLAVKCRQLHGADWCVCAGSGMAALSVATLAELKAGDHVVLSDRLYGRTTQQLAERWTRLGVDVSIVDTLRTQPVAAAIGPLTRLVVVETITNPMLRVTPLRELADLAHQHNARLLVDNTFATPYCCRPLEHGADLVLESVSKMMNGHSDVMLGVLCGRGAEEGQNCHDVASVWGLASSPFDCWLAARGLSTFHLRMERACDNALHVAHRLVEFPGVERVVYPGLESHPDRAHAVSLFDQNRYGTMISFDIPGGRSAVARWMHSLEGIDFCPSLGEVATSVSHPASTSHRRASAELLRRIGITQGTVRLSIGTESQDWIWRTLQSALQAIR